MKYMLLVYSSENAWTPEEWKACTVESGALCAELAERGEFIDASPLHPVSTAKTVRVRDKQIHVTTGPFAETVEQLGGYFILELDNLNRAIEIAARLPAAKKGTIEIRPLLEVEGFPPAGSRDYQASTMTPFMLLCYDDEAYWSKVDPSVHREAIADAVRRIHSLSNEGKFIDSSPLKFSSSATSVRIRNNKRVITDGPFAETNEILGGFYLIYSNNLDGLIDFAAQHPGVSRGAVEIRPVYVLSGLPTH